MDEERQMILRMLKEGKISVEEADALLQALAEQLTEQAEGALVAGSPEMPELRLEIGKVIGEIMKSVPKEVLKGIGFSAKGVGHQGFSHVLQGLWGLSEGQTEASAEEPMAAGETLELRNAWGDVHLSSSADGLMRMKALIRVWGADSTEAERIAAEISVQPRRHGPIVIIAVPRPEGWRVRVDFDIAVPAGVNVALGEAKGDVRALGLQGALHVRVASGDVQVTDQRGPVYLDVKSGDLTVRRVDGDVHLDVKSGDLTMAEIRGKIEGRVISGDVNVDQCNGAALDVINGDLTLVGVEGGVSIETKSGDVDLRQLRSNAIRVRAISGDIQVVLNQLGDGEMSVETVSGDIALALPPDARGTIDASVRSGEVDCALPLRDRSGDRRTLRGVLNEPGARIVLRALSGDIDIRSSGA